MTDQPQTPPAPSTKAAARSAGAGAKKPKTHAAAAGRILAAGLSAGATFGLVAALAANAPAVTVKLSSSAGSKDSPIMKGDSDPIEGDALPGDDHLGDGRVGVDPSTSALTMAEGAAPPPAPYGQPDMGGSPGAAAGAPSVKAGPAVTAKAVSAAPTAPTTRAPVLTAAPVTRAPSAPVAPAPTAAPIPSSPPPTAPPAPKPSPAPTTPVTVTRAS